MILGIHRRGNACGRSRREILLPGIIGLIIFLSAAPLPTAAGQETDPFYLKRLENGEASYLAKNYEAAIQSLDIAVFGLAKDKNSLARGYVLLALCRTALGQKEKAAANLTSAAALVGWDGLRTMEFRDTAKMALDKLLSGIAQTPAPLPAPPLPEPKTTKETSAPPVVVLPSDNRPTTPPATETAPIEDLQRRIETDPRDPRPYYELSLYYRQKREYGTARDTLEKMLAGIPAEIRGYLEIGRLDYLSGNAKSAVKTLEKFLSLAESVRIEERWIDEGRALLILGVIQRGDQKKAARLITESEALFRPERFEKLTLEPADLERLRMLRRPSASGGDIRRRERPDTTLQK